MNFVKIPVAATVRIVSRIKNKPLTEVENFNPQVQVVAMVYPKGVLIDIVQTDVSDKYEEAFKERLKKDHSLRNKIGGVKWRVDVQSVQFSDEGLVK